MTIEQKKRADEITGRISVVSNNNMEDKVKVENKCLSCRHRESCVIKCENGEKWEPKETFEQMKEGLLEEAANTEGIHATLVDEHKIYELVNGSHMAKIHIINGEFRNANYFLGANPALIINRENLGFIQQLTKEIERLAGER